MAVTTVFVLETPNLSRRIMSSLLLSVYRKDGTNYIRRITSLGQTCANTFFCVRLIPLVLINTGQENMKVREVIPHIGPIPIVIPLKLFLDLQRDPVFPRGLTNSQSYVPIFTIIDS